MSKLNRREFIKNSAVVIGTAAVGTQLAACGEMARTSEPVNGAISFIHATDTHLDLNKPESVKWMEMLVQKINNEYGDIDFVLFGGDNFNNNVAGNVDAQTFKDIVDKLHCPYYSVRGNKEACPKPADALNQKDFSEMFYHGVSIEGRNWKFDCGDYTILGLDSTISGKSNGIIDEATMAFVEKELNTRPQRQHLTLQHHVYDNFWQSTEKKDIHKYVLNNAQVVKDRLFKYDNLLLTLAGHKHLDSVIVEQGTTKISTVGFTVPQDITNLDDHHMRYVQLNSRSITEKIVSTV
ncbi:MAG: metallophosphoesterase [Planctomycetes bacterium]|nr:metallophosphoesterase [Planctomycetota bacterium]